MTWIEDPFVDFENRLSLATSNLRGGSDEVDSHHGADRREHFEGLAHLLFEATSDPDLAMAGFFHDQLVRDLRANTPPPSEGVLDILEGWELLVYQDMYERDISQKVIANVLPEVKDPRSFVLYVCELLHSLDETGAGYHASCAFRTNPSEAVEIRPSTFPEDEHWSLETTLEAVTKVLLPLTHIFGMWEERNSGEDLVLQLKEPQAHQKICRFAVEQSRPQGPCDEQVALLQNTLEGISPSVVSEAGKVKCFWTWRHPGSIYRRLRGVEESKWPQTLHRCGYVTIQCDSADEVPCYAILAYLHGKFDFRNNQLLDLIGTCTSGTGHKRSRTNYRALHTRLSHPDVGSMMVRILPGDVNLAPRKRDYGPILARMKEGSSVPGLTAYTPLGEPHQLEPGATVLNFAASVHNDMVGRLMGARINGNSEQVSVLHPLRDGDEVHLILADSTRTLPWGWEEQVPSSSVRGIKKKYQRQQVRVSDEEMWSRGRSWLLEQLHQNGYDLAPETFYLDQLLDEAGRAYFPHEEEPPERPGKWWLEQLGRLERDLDNKPSQKALKINAGQAKSFVNEVGTVLLNKFRLNYDLDLQGKETLSIDELRICPACNPRFGDDVVVETRRRTLTLHMAQASCGEEGTPAGWAKHEKEPRYFLVSTSNRVGVAEAILGVFRRYSVDILEMAARLVQQRQGAIRVETAPITKELALTIARELEAMDTVHNVGGIESQPDSVLEDCLPPRMEQGELMEQRPNPYVVGAVIPDPWKFYGRKREIGVLEEALTRISPSRSASVFLKGTYKVGKTSLFQFFLRELKRRFTRPFLRIYFQASRNTVWNKFEDELILQLHKEIARLEEEWELTMSVPPPKTRSAVRLLRHVRKQWPDLSIIIGIDEVATFFDSLGKVTSQRNMLRSFADELENLKNTLVVWIGPSAPVEHLHMSLVEILRKASQLELEAFTQREAWDFLCQTRHQPPLHIEAWSEVVKEAWQYTAGNPIWLAFLGHHMYKYHLDGGVEPIMYTPDRLRDAKVKLLGQWALFYEWTAFQGDIEASQYMNPKLVPQLWRTLCVMARAGKTPDGYAAWMTNNEVYSALRKAYQVAEDVSVSQALDELALWGIVEELPGQPVRWRLSAPVLTDHINFLLSKKPGLDK